MKSIGIVTLVLSFLTSGLAVRAQEIAAPRDREVELFLRNIWSDQTTEHGADEVYVLVLATSNDGRRIATRIPANAPHMAAGHWDMNDDKELGCNRSTGDSHCIEDRSLGTFSTNGGRTWDVVVAFMEEDRGLGRHVEDILTEAIATSDGNFIVAALNVLLGLWKDDTDDFLGSVGAHISAGRVSWRKIDRILQAVPYPNERRYGFQLVGDGANYTAHIDLR